MIYKDRFIMYDDNVYNLNLAQKLYVIDTLNISNQIAKQYKIAIEFSKDLCLIDFKDKVNRDVAFSFFQRAMLGEANT